MRTGLVLIGCLSGLVLSTLASAQSIESEAGPLPRFFPHRDAYLALDADRRSHFQLGYTVSSQLGVTPDAIEMWYERSGERISFEIDETGRVQHQPSLEALAEAPTVYINQDRGSMALQMSFEARLPGGPHYAVEDLELALGQANQAMRQAAGVAALFAPRLVSLTFTFDGPAPDAIAVFEDGSTAPLTAQENRVLVRPRDRDMRRLVRIELGAMPQRILLDS